MTATEAYVFFKRKHPDLIVKECCLYDSKYYIFTALKPGEEVDYNDPFYAVNAKNGVVSYFCPTDDIDKWNAARRRQVKWR